MDNTTVGGLVLVFVVVVVFAVTFRERLKIGLKGFGLSFSADGRNSSSRGRVSAAPLAGNTAAATGERSAAVAGNVTGNITTGDRIETSPGAKPPPNEKRGSLLPGKKQ